MSKLSPNAKHELITNNFHTYCKQLQNSGRRFPTNQMGSVNVSKVAEICGAKRGAFEKKDSPLNRLLLQKVSEIGLEAPSRTDATNKNNDTYKGVKGSSNLSRALERATAEIDKQREIIGKLEEEIRRCKLQRQEAELSMDLMLEDGKRRFHWE